MIPPSGSDKPDLWEPSTPDDGDPGRQAWLLLFKIFRTQRREMMGLHAEFQLNPAQLHLLMHLDAQRGRPMSELAETLAYDASYVTGLVDKIEDRGLVQRLPSPEDRRVKLIALTAAGAEIRQRVVDRVSQPPPFIDRLSLADKTALRDIFQRASELATGQTPPA